MNDDLKLKYDKDRWGDRKYLLFLPQFKFVYLKRKCEKYRAKNILLFSIYRVIYEHYKIKYNMDIPAKVEIGGGFKIRHIGGITINPFTKIGENIDILPGVLIGAEDRGRRKGTPTIGNNVFIGANAVIVGKIQIGDDVLIAPNTFINFDVPDHSLVLGNPGKIISKQEATKGYLYGENE